MDIQETISRARKEYKDYLREKHQQRDCYEALLELETRYCRQEPYITLGRYIHVTARKPQSKDKV